MCYNENGCGALAAQMLLEACRNAHIGFELCPTSNFQTKAATELDAYPLHAFLDFGLLATINTDNRTVSHTTLTDEYTFALEKLHIEKEDLRTLYKNSVEISFASDSVKHQLLYLLP